jgi:chemotaxis regulatin CheY-phosphate phosphatase CheZ
VATQLELIPEPESDMLDLIGTRKFHVLWEDFMKKKIDKEEEKELWKKLNELVKSIS